MLLTARKHGFIQYHGTKQQPSPLAVFSGVEKGMVGLEDNSLKSSNLAHSINAPEGCFNWDAMIGKSVKIVETPSRSFGMSKLLMSPSSFFLKKSCIGDISFKESSWCKHFLHRSSIRLSNLTIQARICESGQSDRHPIWTLPKNDQKRISDRCKWVFH